MRCFHFVHSTEVSKKSSVVFQYWLIPTLLFYKQMHFVTFGNNIFVLIKYFLFIIYRVAHQFLWISAPSTSERRLWLAERYTKCPFCTSFGTDLRGRLYHAISMVKSFLATSAFYPSCWSIQGPFYSPAEWNCLICLHVTSSYTHP